MKKGTLLIILLSTMVFLTKRTQAQDYTLSAGLKFSYEYGVVGKFFIDKTDAIEAQLGLRSHGAVFTGLWERHVPLLDVDKLKFYYGFGAHVGGTGDTSNPRYNNTLLVGADGIVGAEYFIPDSPIAVSLDLNPRLEFGHGPYFDLSPGVGLKYVFK